MMNSSRLALVLGLAVATPLPAHAALAGRDLDGDLTTVEAVYDSAHGVTWLADLQAAPLGSWRDAMDWAGNLTVGSVDRWQLARSHDFAALYQAWKSATPGSTWLDCAFGEDRSNCKGSTQGLGSPLFRGFDRHGQENWFSDTPMTETQFILYGIPGEYQFGQWGTVRYYGGFDPTGDDESSPVRLDMPGFALRGLAVVDGDVGAVVPQVPEPHAWVLMAGGLAATAVAMRRRRSATVQR